jgi:hypothetical protein
VDRPRLNQPTSTGGRPPSVVTPASRRRVRVAGRERLQPARKQASVAVHTHVQAGDERGARTPRTCRRAVMGGAADVSPGSGEVTGGRLSAAGQRCSALALARLRRHNSKPTCTQVARRNTHDVETVTILEIDHLTRSGHHHVEDSVEEDLVGQIDAILIGLRSSRAGRSATIQSAVGISAMEHGISRHLFRSL